MPIYASSHGATGDFELCPGGAHHMVCCDVVDHGNIKVQYANKTKIQHKITLRWLTVESRTKDGKPYLVQRRFTCSLHPSSALRKYLEGWRGRPFTEDEANRFDLEVLIGVNGLGNVVHQQKPRGTFAEVVALMPLARGMKTATVQDCDPSYIRVQDRPTDSAAPGEPSSDPVADYDDSDAPPF